MLFEMSEGALGSLDKFCRSGNLEPQPRIIAALAIANQVFISSLYNELVRFERMKKALIVYGGWEGHFPKEVAALFSDWLNKEGFNVTVSDSLDALNRLEDFDLFVPHWTMGEIDAQVMTKVSCAIQNGTGIAGCHGGMGDSFRNSTDWQFIVGGQFVAHPGNDGVRYEVQLLDDELTKNIENFFVETEQYYMHIDPAVKVLAITRFPVSSGPHDSNGEVEMPVIWTKKFGEGKVFYCSLGHHPDILKIPEVESLMRRGMVWASR